MSETKQLSSERSKKNDLEQFRGRLNICGKCESRNIFGTNKCIKSQFNYSGCFPESMEYCSYKETKRVDDNQVLCPFCNHLEFIDEIYDYADKDKEKIQCGSCEKWFMVTFEKTIQFNLIANMIPKGEVK